MGADELGMLRAICAEPQEDTPRLAYADWLDEHGEADRAEFIRVQVRIAAAEDQQGRTQWWRAMRKAHAACYGCSPWCRDRLRERALTPALYAAGLPSGVIPLTNPADVGHSTTFAHALFARGFVSHVTCTAADWPAHADSLYWSPAQMVKCGGCRGHSAQWKTRKPGQGMFDFCEGCRNTGRVPRPFPATAQPIKRVTLTTARANCKAACEERWPGIDFIFPS